MSLFQRRELMATQQSWSFYLYVSIAAIFLFGLLLVFLRFLYLRWIGRGNTSVTTVQMTNYNHPFNAEGQEMQPGGATTSHAKVGPTSHLTLLSSQLLYHMELSLIHIHISSINILLRMANTR